MTVRVIVRVGMGVGLGRGVLCAEAPKLLRDFSPCAYCLLHPYGVRILSQAFLEALLVAERERVCAQLVGVPAGMQALVDLLDDR